MVGRQAARVVRVRTDRPVRVLEAAGSVTWYLYLVLSFVTTPQGREVKRWSASANRLNVCAFLHKPRADGVELRAWRLALVGGNMRIERVRFGALPDCREEPPR